MGELQGRVRTLDQTSIELEQVERRLALQHGITSRDIRGVLLRLDRAGDLPEDELVAD